MTSRWLGLAALLVALGCQVSASEASSGDATKREPPPARVVVAKVRDGELIDRWTFLGEAQSLARAELAAGADGTVSEVAARVGDRVEAGALLVRLDTRLAKARVKAARSARTENRSDLEQAKRDGARAQSLGGGIIPEAEIERDVTRAQSLGARGDRLRAAEREAKVQLGRHRVVAPFDGVIAARYVDPGDWVGPGDAVLELVDDQHTEVIVSVSAELIARVKQGDVARVGGPAGTIDAKVQGIVRALDTTTRTAKLRLVPEETPPWLLPGTSVDVEFKVDRSGEGLIVPRDALVPGPVEVRVMRVVDGTAQPLVVKVVATADTEALVRAETLQAGDVLVVRGNERLRPGQAVEIVE